MEKEKTIDNAILNMCIGVLLGDASLQKNTSKKQEKHRIKFLQSSKHQEYILHLYQKLMLFVRAPVFYNAKRNTYSFQTLFDLRFNELAKIFFNLDGKKIVGEYFEKHSISPISLAYWFMDDGGLLSYNKKYKRKGLVFNTQGFSFHEVHTLCNNLNKAYNFDCWVKANKKKPVLCISGKRYNDFEQLVVPHILPSMRYKLPKI